jgi:hypothetical protein
VKQAKTHLSILATLLLAAAVADGRSQPPEATTGSVASAPEKAETVAESQAVPEKKEQKRSGVRVILPSPYHQR